MNPRGSRSRLRLGRLVARGPPDRTRLLLQGKPCVMIQNGRKRETGPHFSEVNGPEWKNLRNRTTFFGDKWSGMEENEKQDHDLLKYMVRNGRKRETGPRLAEIYGPKWRKVKKRTTAP